jgi:serine/threonine protein phosphatase PrpC
MNDENIKNLGITSGLSKKLLKGQDVALVNNDLMLFAIFDGIGKDENSLEAALIASQTVHSFVEQNYNVPFSVAPKMLVNSLSEAHNEIVIESSFRPVGSTTASVAKLIRVEDKVYLAWASIGDSRIYIRNGEGPLEILSRDESSGIYIDNCLGDQKHFHGVMQKGLVDLLENSEIVIVSDGVIGSDSEDAMKIEELDSLLTKSETAQKAADLLTTAAKKNDDRTAIVLRISN